MRGDVYDAVVMRSGGMCEAEVAFLLPQGETWLRCRRPATDVHHMLPKSRGGRVLDDFGETEHLIHLCRSCHAQAHARKDADGLMIDGSVTWNRTTSRPEYRGTDPGLATKYPRSTTTSG